MKKQNKIFILSIVLFFCSVLAIGLIIYTYYNVVYIGKSYDMTLEMIVNKNIATKLFWYGGIFYHILAIILLVISFIKKDSI